MITKQVFEQIKSNMVETLPTVSTPEAMVDYLEKQYNWWKQNVENNRNVRSKIEEEVV